MLPVQQYLPRRTLKLHLIQEPLFRWYEVRVANEVVDEFVSVMKEGLRVKDIELEVEIVPHVKGHEDDTTGSSS